MGIGLKELLAGSDEIPEQIREKTASEQDTIKELLRGAREQLEAMEREHYPLGKLHSLTAAHKSIVETLSQLFPASSSADEILPTLIYALITSRPEHVNVISDLMFIQRFRASSKVDGEAAYCLVNLEAAISFLETVDLSSLRADEHPQGPDRRGDRPITPRVASAPMELGIAPATIGDSKPLPDTPKPRRFSQLLATSNRIEAAGDSLRLSVLDGADQALDTINNTLENSYRFLFGRLKEHQTQSGNDVGPVVMPKTLEDARKLVSTPPQSLADDNESTGSALEGIEESLPILPMGEPLSRTGTGDKMLELVAGRRQLRDRSVDSTRSGGSGGSKRVAFADNANNPSPSNLSLSNIPPPTPTTGAIENMRNLGNTLNPLNQFAKIPFFGRSTGSGSGSGTPTLRPASSTPPVSERDPSPAPELPSSKTEKETRTLTAVDELRKVRPPLKRFLECKDAKDLKLGEVEELLKEFQRLSTALGKVVSS